MWRYGWLVAVVGCAVEPTAVVEEEGAAPDRAWRGPGTWVPAENPVAAPVAISLGRSGLAIGEVNQAASNGTHLAFSTNSVVCTIDATDGSMDTDDTVVSGTTTTLTDTTGTPGEGMRSLALAVDGLYEVFNGGAAGRNSGISLGSAGAVDAVYVGNGFAALMTDGSVRFDNHVNVALEAQPLQTPLAVVGDTVFVATDVGVLAVTRDGTDVAVPVRADKITADPVSGTLVTAVGSVVRGHGANAWTVALPSGATLHTLTDGGDLGLIIALVEDTGARAAWVLDAATGESLGRLEIGGFTLSLDVSDIGGLLLQVKPNSATSWHITR